MDGLSVAAFSTPLRAEMLESGGYFADDSALVGAGVAECPDEST
jgi:hypothetical protein